jgi:glutathione S-transferase
MPKNPADRAKVRLWTYWCNSLFKPDLDLYKYELPHLKPDETANLYSRLNEHFSKWNQALQTSSFLLGEQITLADIHLFPFARQFMAAKPTFPGMETYSRLLVWLDQLVSRPSFEKVMQKRNSTSG